MVGAQLVEDPIVFRTSSLPGDDLLAPADIVATRAIRIHAPPAAMRPWLVQMGPGRGGAYTYDWIENLFGLNMHSANRIVPEWQQIEVGDGFAAARGARECGWRSSSRSGSLEPLGGRRLGLDLRACARKRLDSPDQSQPDRDEGRGRGTAPRDAGDGAGLAGDGAQDAPGHQGARGAARR